MGVHNNFFATWEKACRKPAVHPSTSGSVIAVMLGSRCRGMDSQHYEPRGCGGQQMTMTISMRDTCPGYGSSVGQDSCGVSGAGNLLYRPIRCLPWRDSDCTTPS